MEIKSLTKSLNALCKKINLLVDSKINTDEIECDIIYTPKKQLYDFTYTNKGVIVKGWKMEHVEQRNWIRATQKLLVLTQRFEEFKIVVDRISEMGKHNSKTIVSNFSSKVIWECLNKEDKQAQNKTVSLFINDLMERPYELNIIVELHGIALESIRCKIDSVAIIRQTTKEDCEKPMPELEFHKRISSIEYPSAILEIKSIITPDKINEFQIKVARYITMLRLFGEGGVRSISYQLLPETIIRQFPSGTFSGFNEPLHTEVYLLSKAKEEKLRYFLKNYPIPFNLYDLIRKKEDYISVAFDRYSEAIMENGNYIKKINNAIIGLEAIYTNDNSEVTFKLQMRIAKVISFFNEEPAKVKMLVKDGYSIRSKYAHGSLLSEKDIRKLEVKHESLQKIYEAMVHYLRIAILISACSQVSKDKLIDLIDTALIDKLKETELRKFLAYAAKFI